MSIVKNNNDNADTSVTIKRLFKNTALTLGSDSFYFRWYHQVNNSYARLPWECHPGESVFIKCEIEENAQGYIYGYASGANIYVVNDTVNNIHRIEWRDGNTPVFYIPWNNNNQVE